MDDIDLMMMNREFDSEPAKDTCEKYGVHYLNPTRIFTNSDEADTIRWMYRNGKRFHVSEEETTVSTPTRKQLTCRSGRTRTTMTRMTAFQGCGRRCAADGTSMT